ncbi:hypothetical protein C1637_21040 [Chryseobacterium lactis]|uniref:Uncharacterized protein n=1 Tax=Chryseobacterium lactis TaxID=1241981 RepID=A0A3G6RGB2_CHRLC|nr:hypothetical protein [Chryseobacterium lactis]AZA83441.1 hypothetical protein EG342_16820 [Chryseobacterium lactis]AZB03825.1 hypothetical protein EG341_07695 [Chryseobacterium lactis]PNW11598.1 hypothetical protein C1637_21040 [Chryseobacterium lactis]
MKQVKESMITFKIEMLVNIGNELSNYGMELSNSLTKLTNPFAEIADRLPNVLTMKLPFISTGTGGGNRHTSYGANLNLEFKPTMIVRLEIDTDS